MANIKSFFKLTANENRKNFFNIKTLIWGLFLVVFITGPVLLDKAPESSSNDWKQSAKTQIQKLKQQNIQLKSKLKTKDTKDVKDININLDLNNSSEDIASTGDKAHLLKNTKQIEKLEFAIKNNIPIGVKNLSSFITDNLTHAYAIIFLFIIVTTINIIALEHKNNTMKQLLIRPHSRCKILLSKFCSITFSLLSGLIFASLAVFLIGLILYSKNGINLSTISVVDGKYVDSSILIYILKYGLIYFIKSLPLIALAFLISLLFKSSTLPLIISYCFSTAAPMITLFLPKSSWVKYTLFPNLSLKPYLSGATPYGIKGMSLGFSITILLAYSILFLAVSIGFFNKKDIV